MSATKAAFVLVQGGWYSHSTLDRVTSILDANGFLALTLDLLGAGVNARAPRSLDLSPVDPAAFATEPSPSADITQEEQMQAVVALVSHAASMNDSKVILVGHSAGGMMISYVTELVPDLLLAVVYLSGFLTPLAMLMCESMISALSPGLFAGDPTATGELLAERGSTRGLDG